MIDGTQLQVLADHVIISLAAAEQAEKIDCLVSETPDTCLTFRTKVIKLGATATAIEKSINLDPPGIWDGVVAFGCEAPLISLIVSLWDCDGDEPE